MSAAPKPSQRSLDLVGKTVFHSGNKRRGGPVGPEVEVTVVAAEKVFSTITSADGTQWSSVRFKLKPTNGDRAFWTCSMPDEQIGGAA